MKRPIVLTTLLALTSLTHLSAQYGSIKGFVYDSSTGQPLPVATVTIGGTQKGTATDRDGFYLLTRVPAGSQTLRVTYLGFEDYSKQLTVRPDAVEQVVVYMKPSVYQLDEATISAERRRLEHMNPVSAHHMTPVTMNRIPGLTGQSDLAEYLQVIPGVIFTGDRGGQFYVRGGSPVQNLVRLDGMTVVNPFHSIGFASVFDTETIGSVDVYTAGFDSRFGSRISSVIDVRSRLGNRREFRTKASASTFGYGLLAEGPLKKMTDSNPSSLSFILSGKGSWIDRTEGTLYPYLDSTGIPFRYNDLFGRVSLVGRKGDQLDVMGIHFTDIAQYSSTVKSTWETNGGGARFLVTPSGSPTLLEMGLNYSDYRGEFLESGRRPRRTRYNTLEAAITVHYNGPLFKLEWGTGMNAIHTMHTFVRSGNLLTEDEYFTTELFSYLDARLETERLLVEPGFRLQYYADQAYLSPEPRLKFKYRINDLFSLNFATGRYSQTLVSTTSPEDVVSLFQGYYSGPGFVQDTYKGKYIDDKLALAWHAVIGVTYFGPKDLKLSVEGYVKDYYRMIEYNRYKQYDLILNGDDTLPSYLIQHFILEKGWAYGIDFLAEWNLSNWNLYLAYSLGYVTREDEFMKYVPHFDRRHNLNLVAGYGFGARKLLNVKARWNLGSGFPFTPSYGMYETLATGYGRLTLDPGTSGDLGIWYGTLNSGRMPWYHRLDISVQKTWPFRNGHGLVLSLGIMNVYNRRNVFYVDRITMERVDQLPVLPTIGVTLQ
jgi:hypothetical protein